MDNAPAWIQPVVKAMPLYYLANAMRDVMIKGFALWAVRWDILILLAGDRRVLRLFGPILPLGVMLT